MVREKSIGRVFENTFCFESYGVKVRLESNKSETLAQAKATARRALLGRLDSIDCQLADHSFGFRVDKKGVCYLFQDGQKMVHGLPDQRFFRFFDSLVRILVGEFAPEHVFIHAGVVGWKGKAILFPADSFKGKTTLVAELRSEERRVGKECRL